MKFNFLLSSPSCHFQHIVCRSQKEIEQFHLPTLSHSPIFHLNVVFFEYVESLLHISHLQFHTQVGRLDGLNSAHNDFEVGQYTYVAIEIQPMFL